MIRIITYGMGISPNKSAEKEKAIIGQVSEIIRNLIAIPCTGCCYCVEGCPEKIPIPDIFSIYNERERTRDVYYPKVNYGKLVDQENHDKASQCIKCRKCENHCPQHIKITEQLELIAKEFE